MNDYFTFFYVKHFELPLCMKCAIQINLPCLNFSTVSQAVISCLNSNNVNFNDIWAFVTDSASYMKKAYNTIIHGLFPNANHVTCLAHAAIGFRGVS